MRFSKGTSTKKVNVAAATPIIRGTSKTKLNGSLEQATVIRLKPEYADDGFAVLLSTGQVQALPEETYVVGPEHIGLLDSAGIEYDVLPK
jgi:hypothetical protein